MTGVQTCALPISPAAINPYSIIDMQLELQIIELSDEGQHMVDSITPFSSTVYMQRTHGVTISLLCLPGWVVHILL